MTIEEQDDDRFALGRVLEDTTEACLNPQRRVTLWGGRFDGVVRELPRDRWQYTIELPVYVGGTTFMLEQHRYAFTCAEDVRRGRMRSVPQ